MVKCRLCETDYERGSVLPVVRAFGLQRVDSVVCWRCFKQLLDVLEDGSKVARLKGALSGGIQILDAKPKK
jgi:hypothetical protein